LEQSRDAVKDLKAIDEDLAVWTPYPAAFSDNPLVSMPFKVLGHTIDDFSHIGVYHQKFVNILRKDKSFLSYLGGMDISPDRVDTPMHRVLHPFHDVQVKIQGSAALDVLTTFSERAKFYGTSSVITKPTSSDDSGHHLIQIARTYFRPKSGSGTKPLDAAPSGESTTVNTLKKAIRSAKDFIYIEDQYFTPPDDYIEELLNAADPKRNVKALLVTVPYHTDQPFGGFRRADIVTALTAAWGPRFNIGAPFRRYLHPTPGLITNLGRLRLAIPLGASDSRMTVVPNVHVPVPPFWCYVDSELVLVVDTLGGPTAGDSQTLTIVRHGGWGASPVTHLIGAPVLCAQIPQIYVHAKVTIIDDVFLFAGSSNMNRRGTYHDGEINSFTISEHLKSDPSNPARLLRCRLWAEHLGLPSEVGISLLADPLSAILLFKARNWYQGSHRQPLSFIYSGSPPTASVGLTSNAIMEALQIASASLSVTALKDEIWPSLADPTTELQPTPRKPGPNYP
jgi:phosphatidylserine/phosphatidylglycerophosphate/cardiolipin synthase-like enzyme